MSWPLLGQSVILPEIVTCQEELEPLEHLLVLPDMRICIVVEIARPCGDTQSFQSSQKDLKVQSHELLRRVVHLVPDVDGLSVLSPVGSGETEFVLITRQIKHIHNELIDLTMTLNKEKR